MRRYKINVVDVTGTSLCVSALDGERLFKRLSEALETKGTVVISFKGVERLTTAFLNAAVGQLYGKYSESRISSSFAFRDLAPTYRTLLHLVCQRAKIYFSNKESIRAAINESED